MSHNIFSRSSRLAAITTTFHWRKQNKQWCSKKKKNNHNRKQAHTFFSINIYLFWLRIECSLFRHHWTLLNPYIKKDFDEIWHSITDQLESALCGKIYFVLKDKVIDDVFITQVSLLTTAFQLDCKGRHPGGSHPKGLIVKLITTLSRFALWYLKLYTKTAC